MDGPGALPQRIPIPIIYVAGRFRGPTNWDVEQNVRLAEAFGLEIAKIGAMPLIPHTMNRFFHGILGDQFWLDGTLRLLEVSDAMVLIPGWRGSEGACNERAKMDEWRRRDRIFYLDNSPVERIRENDDYTQLITWIGNFKTRACT